MRSFALPRGLAAALLALSSLLPAAAQAPTAPPSEGRNDYVLGATARPASPVRGDFMGVGGRVTVDQPVSGDLLAAGGTIDVRAPVGDDVRASGGDITIDAPVGGELLAFGGELTIGRSGAIARDATVFAGKVTLSGSVGRRLEVHAGKLFIDGVVQGDVDAEVEDIELGPNARITGKLVYTADSELKRADGAVVGGALTRKESKEGKRRADREQRGWKWTGPLLTFLGLLACAALFQLVAPAFSSRAAQRIGQDAWLSAGIGVAALIGIPVAVVILCITLIGIPFGLIVLLLYPLLLLFGFLTGLFFLADRLPAALRREPPESLGVLMAYVAATLLLVLLLGRIPGVGGLLIAAVLVVGMGALTMELHARWRARRAARA
jgi:hypothetical protein